MTLLTWAAIGRIFHGVSLDVETEKCPRLMPVPEFRRIQQWNDIRDQALGKLHRELEALATTRGEGVAMGRREEQPGDAKGDGPGQDDMDEDSHGEEADPHEERSPEIDQAAKRLVEEFLEEQREANKKARTLEG